MKCEDVFPLLEPLVDGELRDEDAKVALSHLAECPDCHTELEALKSLRNDLLSIERPRVPGTLRSSIVDAIESHETDQHVFRLRGRSAITHGLAAMLGALALFVFVQWPFFPERIDARSVVEAHVRSLADGRLMQVAAGNPHRVKPWFAGKLDFAPVVVDVAEEGFPLLGGRVDDLDGEKVAALVYSRRAHLINLFVMPVDTGHAMALTSSMERGFSINSWSDGGYKFWAVSDLSAGELENFVYILRQKINLIYLDK